MSIAEPFWAICVGPASEKSALARYLNIAKGVLRFSGLSWASYKGVIKLERGKPTHTGGVTPLDWPSFSI